MGWTRRATVYAACAVGLAVGLGCVGIIGADAVADAAPAPLGGHRATPQTFQQQLSAMRDGETLTLEPGNYGETTISWHNYQTPVTIDASRAQFVRLVLRQVNNIIVKGGTVISPRDAQQAVTIDTARNVTVRDMHISGARIATTIARSQHVNVINNDFSGTRSDGVNIAMSQHVQIIGNICRNFNPLLPTYDAAGKETRGGGDHPDCVQAWSRPTFPPTSDVLVADNTAEGFMQGIFFGDPGNGGYDHIVIKDNHLRLSVWGGIVVYEGRDVTVTGNDVATIPGSKWIAYPFRPIVAHIKFFNSTNVRACDNHVEQPRMSDGVARC